MPETPLTLDRLLEQGLAAHADAVAVNRGALAYTFADLDRLSDAVARHLVETLAIGHGDRVVVLAEKAPEIVIAALGIWKAGAVYAPIDAKNPPRRTEHIIAILSPRAVISSAARLAACGAETAGLPQLAYEHFATLAPGPFARPAVTPEDDGVIIHTSGSTGFPKGAVLTHDSVTTYFGNHNEIMGFGPDSVGMNNGPFHFDVSIQDTFLPLFFGARVVFHDDLFLSRLMLPLIAREGVTHLIAVSSVLALVSDDDTLLASLGEKAPKTVITGGELCDVKLINRWLDHYPEVNLNYGYGPTECNSLCLSYRVRTPEPARTAPYPIGRPFPGHAAFLLDEKGKVIEEANRIGVLAIAGPQVMRGYWGKPDETTAVIRHIDGKRAYVTGDHCWRDPDGLYHFAGRTDTEVKIRGRRINLAEVRNALLAHPDVSYAVAGIVEAGGETRIFGFVQTPPEGSASLDAIEASLVAHLPDYMRPWYLCRSPGIARTSTAKVSEKAIVEAVTAAIAADPSRPHLVLQL